MAKPISISLRERLLFSGEKTGEFKLKTVSGHRRITTLEFKNTDVNGDLILTGSNAHYVDLRMTEMSFRRMYDVIELYYTEELTETN